MTEKHKITNLEAHTTYFKKFKSNTETARQFLVDEGLKKGKKTRKEVGVPSFVTAIQMDQDET